MKYLFNSKCFSLSYFLLLLVGKGSTAVAKNGNVLHSSSLSRCAKKKKFQEVKTVYSIKAHWSPSKGFRDVRATLIGLEMKKALSKTNKCIVSKWELILKIKSKQLSSWIWAHGSAASGFPLAHFDQNSPPPWKFSPYFFYPKNQKIFS